MLLREYGEEDLEEILRLFYRTVHVVAAADYSEEQLDAWAPVEADREKWRASLAEHFSLVAEENGKIVAFGDAVGGYLDLLYVAADFQGRGAGSLVAGALEEYARARGAEKMTVHASLTARAFFEKSGYKVLERRRVDRKGVELTNFLMEKIF